MKIRLLCAWEPGLEERETVAGVEILRFKGNSLNLRARIPQYFKKHLEDSTDIVWDEVDFSVPWFTTLFTRKPVLMHCLHFQRGNFFLELPFWKATLAYALEPLFYKLYRRRTVLTISESTRDSLAEIGFPKENIHIVSPGLDPSTFENPESVRKKKSGTPLVVSLSRLRAWKGVNFAILAMKSVVDRIPDAKLCVIGTGPHENVLREMTTRLDLDGHVQFLGKLSEQDKLEWLKKAHVLTKTSGREGWGIDVLEANMCLTPAVGWNVPGTKDSIQNGSTGFLVPFPETNRLAGEICRLLEDKDLREKMADEAHRFSSQFTWDKSAQKIESLLNAMTRHHA